MNDEYQIAMGISPYIIVGTSEAVCGVGPEVSRNDGWEGKMVMKWGRIKKKWLELVRISWNPWGQTRTKQNKLGLAFVSHCRIHVTCRIRWCCWPHCWTRTKLRIQGSWRRRAGGHWRAAGQAAGPCLCGEAADQRLTIQWSSEHKNVFCFTSAY